MNLEDQKTSICEGANLVGALQAPTPRRGQALVGEIEKENLSQKALCVGKGACPLKLKYFLNLDLQKG